MTSYDVGAGVVEMHHLPQSRRYASGFPGMKQQTVVNIDPEGPNLLSSASIEAHCSQSTGLQAEDLHGVRAALSCQDLPEQRCRQCHRILGGGRAGHQATQPRVVQDAAMSLPAGRNSKPTSRDIDVLLSALLDVQRPSVHDLSLICEKDVLPADCREEQCRRSAKGSYSKLSVCQSQQHWLTSIAAIPQDVVTLHHEGMKGHAAICFHNDTMLPWRYGRCGCKGLLQKALQRICTKALGPFCCRIVARQQLTQHGKLQSPAELL
mmetsp:Transcript_30671/g.71668  ORF Transcript_30671/g.71668 Transcript_30671/m.71668 type:complete len:265 (+) Transcript_30671:457-1251(+)